MSKFIYAVLRSEVGKAECMNCGASWGDHSGIRCNRASKGSRTFEPLGFYLSDICDKCGMPMRDHYKRVGCMDNGKQNYEVFEYCKDMFTDKEFLI